MQVMKRMTQVPNRLPRPKVLRGEVVVVMVMAAMVPEMVVRRTRDRTGKQETTVTGKTQTITHKQASLAETASTLVQVPRRVIQGPEITQMICLVVLAVLGTLPHPFSAKKRKHHYLHHDEDWHHYLHHGEDYHHYLHHDEDYHHYLHHDEDYHHHVHHHPHHHHHDFYYDEDHHHHHHHHHHLGCARQWAVVRDLNTPRRYVGPMCLILV